MINIADAGQSPQDGFTEYQGYPGQPFPRWGDYSEGIYLPGSGGEIYFANEYIQYPNCTGPAFTLTRLAGLYLGDELDRHQLLGECRSGRADEGARHQGIFPSVSGFLH